MITRLLRIRPQRRLIAFVGCAVIAALVVGLASHVPTDSAARQRADERAPDRMVAAWSIDVDIRPGDDAVAVSDKLIAVKDIHGVRLLDSATGQPQKILPDVGGRGIWMSDSVLVVETDKTVLSPRRLSGFEYTTGRQLWSTELRDYGAEPLDVEVFSGVVVYRDEDREGIAALDAYTGKPLWSRKMPGAVCPYRSSEDVRVAPAGGGILSVLARCRDSGEVFGIGVTDGLTRWRKQLDTPIDDVFCFNADGPVIIIDSANWFSLLNLAGEVLLTRREPREPGGPSCAIHATDRGVVMARNSLMELIDPQSGYSHWQKRDPQLRLGIAGGQLYAGGRLYIDSDSESTSGSGLLPSFVSSIDLSTGDNITLPLPVRGDLVGTTANLLIYKTSFTRTIRYTAIRPETGRLSNPVLAGATPNDWPDACSFLSTADLDSLGGFTAFPDGKGHQVFGVELPHPTRCDYLAASSDSVFSVVVSWVSSDRAALTVLLETQADERGNSPEKIGDGVFIIHSTDPHASQAFLLRGPYTLRIKVPNNSRGDDEQLTRKVAKLLLASAPDSGIKSNNSVQFDVDAAHLVIKNFGYTPDLAPLQAGPLRAITAICTTSATEYCQQIFFFFGQEFVGVGRDPAHGAIYQSVKIVGQDGQSVRVSYGVYEREDANCCPSGEKFQTYRYEGNKLEYQNGDGMRRPAPYDPVTNR